MVLPDAIHPLYVLSGFCVGALVGMTGVGGGSLMTPLLILLFGVHPASAVGTDLLFAASTKTVGTLAHGVTRTIEWRLVGLLALGSLPATAVTILLLSQINLHSARVQHSITVLLGLVLLVTALFLIVGQRLRHRYSDQVVTLPSYIVTRMTVALGAVMGLLVTATSVGAGAIGVTTLLLLHPRMSAARVVGSDIAHAVPLTVLAGLGHWWLGSIQWTLLGTLLIGSLPGIIIGSYMAGRVRDGVVRGTLAGVLLVVALRLLI